MKKRLRSLGLALCLALGLMSSCAAPQEEAFPDTENTVSSRISFTDDLGRTVSVDSPKRVAALLGSFAQIWTLAGGTVCASADDAWDDFRLELPEDVVNLGNTKELSLELLLASQPDLILASCNTRQHMEWLDTLESTRIPTAYFEVSHFEDYLRMLSICTDLTGRKDLYQEHGLAVQEEIEAVLARSSLRLSQSQPPTVLSLRASASSIRAKNSRDNVLGEMLKNLGCINIADSNDSLLEALSLEHILVSDPDYIFFVQQGDDAEGTQANIRRLLEENPAWSQLTAVKSGRVYYMEKSLFGVKPGHRWGEAYELVEDILSNE